MIHAPLDITKMTRDAGWMNQTNRAIAVAVCWAESRFNDQAINENKVVDPETGEERVDSIDRGLMQINSKWQPQVSEACAFDPICNLVEAHKIYVGRGYRFTAWSAYNNGSYRDYLDEAKLWVDAEIRWRKALNEATALRTERDILTADLLRVNKELNDVAMENFELNQALIEAVSNLESAKNNLTAMQVEQAMRIFGE